MPPSASLVFLSCSLYREHSSLNSFAVRDEQASPVPALLRSLYHEPALTRFIACYAGCSFSNGTRKTNAAFGVACFSFVLIILQHFTSFVHCFPTRGTFYEKGSCKAGFSACGGSRKRHSSIPPQCDPRGAFLSYGNEVSYTIKKRHSRNCHAVFRKNLHSAGALRRRNREANVQFGSAIIATL